MSLHDVGHSNKGLVSKHSDDYGGNYGGGGYHKQVYGHDGRHQKNHDVNHGAAYGGQHGGHQGGYGGVSGGGQQGYYVKQPPVYYRHY